MKKIAKIIKLLKNKDIFLYIIIIFIGFIVYTIDIDVKNSDKCVILFNNKKIIKDISVDSIIDFDNVVIEIKNKKVRVVKSNCPDKLCVKTGFIQKQTEFIICVPNNLKITIGEENNIDGISW
ncbi:MAG: NusG domain II-containing protein [Candidatus Muirbacterium halophilum]|nr:NusG domain II-containing protein [Candidatus Muirbacterium halophilum]MCK9475459.1 NusG domain II-containing protein [Candidatus Muirbacterium halophilum]